MYLCVWNYCALSNLYWRISHWMGFAVIMLSVGAEKRTSELCSASTNTRFPDTEYCVNQRLNLKDNIVRLNKTISIVCPKLLSRLGEIKQSKVEGMYFLKIPLLISASEHSYSKVVSSSDQPKQCFTVLPEQNRTSQSKFCFPNLNRTEPNT